MMCETLFLHPSMAPSPSTRPSTSSSSSSSSYGPYDWRVKVKDYVDIELPRGNYPDWEQAMLDFIEMQGMKGFLINPPPQKTPALATDHGEEVKNDGASTSGDNEIDDGPDLEAWKRSDRLLRRWILATLSPTLRKRVSECKTAGDVWKKLKENYNKKRKRVADKKAKELKPRASTAISYLTSALELSMEKFVRKVVEIMSADEVLQTDREGLTALHVAARTGNLEAVKLLESKNKELLNICSEKGYPPLFFAALGRKRQVVDYLFPSTPKDSRKGNVGNTVAACLIYAGFYDVALNWIRGPPELECEREKLIWALARKPSSFESGVELNVWQSLIYPFIKTNHKNSGDIKSVEDPHVSVIKTNQENSRDIESAKDQKVSGCHITWGKLYAVLWKVTAGRLRKSKGCYSYNYKVPQIEDVKKKKEMHYHATELLRHLCSKIKPSDAENIIPVLVNSIENAACKGMHGIVDDIFGIVFGDVEMRHALFHRAVIHRWEKVFDCLIHKNDEDSPLTLHSHDKEGNTVLHLAANLTSEQLTKLKQKVATPVLQIQRELQWFKEVQKLLYPEIWEERNHQQQTATQLFTESHKELLKEGEMWMKNTANSCSVVAALIVTIIFAAAITVPGGNNSENGNPILFDDLAFKIFALSDGFAFFSSSFSVIMFLSILTARFAEEDFLKSLPRRLIFGFISLFLSIICMMAAFSVTVYLCLGQKKVWILALVTAMGLLPVASFAFLQFPLLWTMIKSTYFPLHFRKKNKAKFFGRCQIFISKFEIDTNESGF